MENLFLTHTLNRALSTGEAESLKVLGVAADRESK